MTSQATIDQIADAVAARLRPAIPIDVALWDAKACGAYIKKSGEYFRDHVATLPHFPPAIRIPSESGGRGHPLWRAIEVIEWVAKHREKT